MAIPTTHKATNKYRWAVLIVLSTIILLCSAACREEKEKNMTQNVTLELGRSGPQTFQQAGAAMDNRTAGEIAGFLDLKWKPSALGNVTIKHGGHSLTIPHTFTVMGTVWPKPAGEGVASIDLNSGISADELIRHREAYDLWVKLMEQIQDSGWQPFIELSQPRLSGKDALRYFQDKENFGLGHAIDPYILPDFQTWLTVVAQRGIFTYFHLNGLAMSISLDQTVKDQEDLDRINNKLNFTEWGQYMLDIKFTTTRYNTRNFVYHKFIPDDSSLEQIDEEIKKINADLPTYLKRYQNIELSKRKQEEERLAKLGYKIDTTYQDPDPLPYLQQEPKF
ncbi:hypothetical protein [Neisseria dumasiana]|uniref:Lipoprotein n=1 Tax=Neisseria dumasiana TaxID=1931275 RepID=A0ABX3WPN7_9NEIS|nr:hypothetical protein [Neisseria dumasiana]OSI35833.1 hypothetical protein BV913_04155 [Neisseria dumasiana]UOO85301.1 hypothetical protein LVJ88_04785 [Neisseria dumasiana]